MKQFTRHHSVSSVLHQPLSQIIHCIVFYLDSCKYMFERFGNKLLIQLNDSYASQQGGDKKNTMRELFELFVEAIPFWSSISHSRSTGYIDS